MYGIGNDRPRETFGPISSMEWDGVGESKDEVKRDTLAKDGIKSLRCFDKLIKQ